MKKILILTCILVSYTFVSCSLEKRANFFMAKANKDKVKAGCYYIQGDTVVIQKTNHR